MNKIKLGRFEVDEYQELPKGWKEDKGATTAPVGFIWITNGKSLFRGERKSGLIREENLRRSLNE